MDIFKEFKNSKNILITKEIKYIEQGTETKLNIESGLSFKEK